MKKTAVSKKVGPVQVHAYTFESARQWRMDAYFGKTYFSLTICLGFFAVSIWIVRK